MAKKVYTVYSFKGLLVQSIKPCLSSVNPQKASLCVRNCKGICSGYSTLVSFAFHIFLEMYKLIYAYAYVWLFCCLKRLFWKQGMGNVRGNTDRWASVFVDPRGFAVAVATPPAATPWPALLCRIMSTAHSCVFVQHFASTSSIYHPRLLPPPHPRAAES